jgi:hypothetical protein
MTSSSSLSFSFARLIFIISTPFVHVLSLAQFVIFTLSFFRRFHRFQNSMNTKRKSHIIILLPCKSYFLSVQVCFYLRVFALFEGILRLNGWPFCFAYDKSRVKIAARNPAIQIVFVLFLGPSRLIPRYYLKISHDCLLPYPRQFIFTNHIIIRRYIT